MSGSPQRPTSRNVFFATVSAASAGLLLLLSVLISNVLGTEAWGQFSFALALSMIGVYGVMAYAVSERTHEIGVRLALGAAPEDIRSLVVREGVRLAGLGIAIGLAAALAFSRALTSLLFGISPTDPPTFVVSAIGLAAAAVAAAYGPAKRASRIDPVVLLR
jgi:ABC-type antimicrobial peptide transport system permease subunit